MQEAWKEAQRILSAKAGIDALAKYRDDPVAFGREILKEHYTDEVVQVMQSVRDNRVTIARSANAVGKSFAAARIALWWYKVYPDSQVYMTAAPPLENLRRILWGHVAHVIQTRPELFATDRTRSLSIYRSPRSYITGVAIPTSGSPEEREAKFSGKHAPHLLFIVDEGDAVPDEVYKGIESCMSGEHDRLLIMFNPRSATGPVYLKEANRQANVIELSALNHPNVVSGRNIIPGAVTRDTTLRRINVWTRPLMPKEVVDSECFEVPDYLVGQEVVGLDGTTYPPIEIGWRKISDPAFSYMVLGKYPAQSETQLINQAWIDAAVQRWKDYVAVHGEVPPDGVRPIMGLDVAELGADWNVAVFRYGPFVAKPTYWRGVDPDASSTRALDLYNEKNVDLVMVDGTGIGSSVAPAMARRGRSFGADVRAISVKLANKPSGAIKTELGEFRTLRDQLWWALREWLRTDPQSMLPPDRLLIEELKTPQYFPRDDGKIEISSKETLRDLLRRSPDRADALCLTFTPMNRAKILRLGDE